MIKAFILIFCLLLKQLSFLFFFFYSHFIKSSSKIKLNEIAKHFMLLENKSFRLLILKLNVISNIKRKKRRAEKNVVNCEHILVQSMEDLCFSCEV